MQLIHEVTPESYEIVKGKLDSVYTKQFSVSHANEIFIDLTSARKEKIVRALYLDTIRRKWENEGCLHWDVLSSRYFRELEYQKLYHLSPVREYEQKYIVIYDPWRIKWTCQCQYFSLYGDNCTHVLQVRILNILKEYIPYFIYAYRFLLPHRCYLAFMSEFGHKPLLT